MDQEVTFGGLSYSPSGHRSHDGDLAMCVGLMPENGELAQVGSVIADPLPDGYELMCRHTTPHGSRLIARYRQSGTTDGDLLYWCPAMLGRSIVDADLICIDEFAEVRSVAACGLMLVVATSEGLEYAHSTANGYAMLDVRQPPILEFGLERAGALVMEKRYAVPSWMATSANQGNGEGAWTTHPATSARATETDSVARTIFANFKTAVASQIEGRGYWHSPFFLRYALRLHDGTHILPSPPMLMLPSLLPPMLKATATASCDEAVLALDASGMNYCSLRCRISRFSPSALGPYVAAIDVFATECVPTYGDEAATGGIVSYLSIIKNTSLYDADKRGRSADRPIFAGQWSTGGDDYADRFISDPELSKTVWNMSSNPSLASALLMRKDFHLVASIPISEAETSMEFKALDVCDTSAESIRNQPMLVADEADIARRIRPSVVWSDGNGLVAGGGEISLHKPWPLSASIPFVGNRLDPAFLPVTVTQYSRSLVGDGNASVVSESSISPRYSLADAFPHYLYTPDRGTYKVELRQGGNAWSLAMRPHPTMPGAYWVGDLTEAARPEAESLPPLFNPDTQPVKAESAVYVSPKPTPLAMVRRAEVGEGAVRFMAPAFKSMSSGQFGQFPLYVFTSAGIWTLPASLAAGPVRISGDAANSIAVGAEGVAYTTDEGVYMLSGARSECISSDLMGYGDRWLLESDAVAGLLQAEGIEAASDIRYALKSGRLNWDGPARRLTLTGAGCAYIYSMADEKWGMAMSGDKAVIITRPIKLGAPATRKRLTGVALTGPLSLRRTKVAVVGSDDLRHWRLLGSAQGTAITAMRGTGARYIAVVACSELKPGQTMSGCTFFY